MVKPAFFKHADLFEAEVSSGLPLRVAFAGLWTVADRRGVFPWSRNIKPDVLPYDNCDMIAVLNALHLGGFVVRYEVDGKPYGYIPSFQDHQTFHKNEKESSLPAPSQADASTVLAPDQHSSRPTVTSTVEGTSTSTGASTTNSTSPSAEFDAADELLGRLLPPQRPTWAAEIRVAGQGMHGPPLLPEQIQQACRDYVADGHMRAPKLSHFRGYLRNAARPREPTPIRSLRPAADPFVAGLQQWAEDADAKTPD